MIDCHCHILAGFDDGAVNTDMSVIMAQLAAADGISTIVATPHIREGLPSPANIQKATQLLNGWLKQMHVPVTVIPGAEVPLIADLEIMADYTINNTSYVLVEFPHSHLPDRFQDIIFQMKVKGFRPIIAHPERHPGIILQPEILFDLHDSDVFVQITADSITGRFGNEIKRCAEYLLQNDVVDIIASDAHSTEGRTPGLSKGADRTGEIIGLEKANKLVSTNPEAVINGQHLS